ncbi:hypothetical protein TSOC_002675 [Tetrabaena socialis]|uniref:Uncharacterized protein n=1 Tax=Tetrabaena socialis TaxID=47790 RepID=A0A2J8ADG0_9CHLO|nr:hypothetical protein TSOC_002675 [Tetrabaena socialis]|eukprot:PNH10558.1 hypothetical protein TSOC_002675 [Tetrabaena socialis]
MLKRAQLSAHRPVAFAPRTRQLLVSPRPPLQHTQRLAPLPASGPAPLVYAEGFKEVEELAGARIVVDSDAQRVEYLTKWKAPHAPVRSRGVP